MDVEFRLIGVSGMGNGFLRLRLPTSFFVLMLAFCLEGCGPSSSSSNQPNPQSLSGTIDSLVQTEMQDSGVPGMTVALAKNGAMLYSRGYGVTDLSTGQATETTTIFEIGSITKQFTAALIMRLQEQGRLQLDDSVTKYLPRYGFPPAITLRMLLTHTSGLADFTNFPDFAQWVINGISEPVVLAQISQAPLQFQPGTQYAYSNSNFYLLGTMIESLTGQSYAADLDQYFFQPLALQNTFYVLPPANLSAVGYTHNGAALVPATIWNRSAAFAAGALSSNLDDLVAWDYDLLSGKVVSPASFQQMTTSNGFEQNGYSYGFGLALSTYNDRRLIWHAGQIGGFYTENVVFLDDSFTLIVLTNDQDYDTDPFVFKILNAVCGSSQLSVNC
jgi:CubicO group peptidase (beta-lactamase class C family)